ncbi:MAG: hypothetical protein M3Y68_07950, partial [Chloroflexota bacterium]|nr:hypothetical protein [Chloroflexota bacterium]
AEELNRVLADIISRGEITDPLAREYLDIVLAAQEQGYEIVDLDVQGDQARALATAEPPDRVEIVLQKVSGVWQVQP